MGNKLRLSVWLVTIFLAGCGGGGDVSPGPAVIPVASGPALPAPLPGYALPGYYYHGLLWGSLAGTEYLTVNANCPHVEHLVIAGFCIASITQDGANADAVELRTGQIIELMAYPGISPTIDIKRTIVGLIESIDAEHLWLTVLGQKVHVVDQTQGDHNSLIGDSFDFGSVAVGDYVSVSGHFTRDGQVLATLIELDSGSGPLLLRGLLSLEADGSYTVGAQSVDISGVDFDGFNNGVAVSGDAVLVLASEPPQNGMLVARELRNAGGRRDDEAQGGFKYLFDGFVTDAAAWDLKIAGYHFYYSTWDCNVCENVSDQTVSKLVSYYNNFTYSNILDVNPPTWNGTYLIGPITSVNPSGGNLAVDGFTVQTNPATVISASAAPSINASTLEVADLIVGDIVTITGGVRLMPGGANWIPDDKLAAGSIVAGGEGVQVRTQLYERADPDIIFLGRHIVTDAATTVVACDDGACVDTTPAWVFDNTDYFAPVLTIDVDPGSDPMRATHILAVRDP